MYGKLNMHVRRLKKREEIKNDHILINYIVMRNCTTKQIKYNVISSSNNVNLRKHTN